MRRLGWIVTIPLTVIVLLFAVDNRQPVELELWPLPWAVPAIPLFALALVLILLGFVIGALAMWFSGAKLRRQNRQLRRDLDAAKSELYGLRNRAPEPRSQGNAVTVTQTHLPPAA
jgi:uncharacterized integral membrane protein